MLGILTQGGRMEGANKSSELRRHPRSLLKTFLIGPLFSFYPHSIHFFAVTEICSVSFGWIDRITNRIDVPIDWINR